MHMRERTVISCFQDIMTNGRKSTISHPTSKIKLRKKQRNHKRSQNGYCCSIVKYFSENSNSISEALKSAEKTTENLKCIAQALTKSTEYLSIAVKALLKNKTEINTENFDLSESIEMKC